MKHRLLSAILCLALVLAVVNPVMVMADYSDYVPGAMPTDLLSDGWIYGNTNSKFVSFGWSNNYGSDPQFYVKEDFDYDPSAAWSAHGTLINSAKVNGGTALSPNTTYVFTAQFKNAGDASATPKFTMYYYGKTSDAFPNEYGIDGWTPGIEYTDYKITFNTGDNESGTIIYGLVNGKKDDTVYLNYKSNMYLAEEVAYDITNAVTGAAELLAGESTTIQTEVVNQIGIKGTLDQNFSYTVLNEDRTQVISDGISVTAGQDGEATVEVSTDVPTGKYVILASSDDYTDLQKGVTIKVENEVILLETIEKIKSESAEVLAENIGDYIDVLSVSDDYVLKADATELAKVIAGGVADETIDDKEAMQKYIRRCAVVALYNAPSDDIDLFDGEYAFNYADVLKLEDIDQNGVTIYNEATQFITTEGMQKVQTALTGKSFANYGEFADAVAAELVLKAISDSTDKGVAYLDEVLTAQNLDKIGVEAADFLALSNNVQFLRESIKGQTFTVETLAEALASAYESDMAALNADYVAGAVTGCMFAYPANINQYTPNNGTGGTMYRGEMVEPNKYTLDLQKVYGFLERSSAASVGNSFMAGPCYFTTADGNKRLIAPIQKGKTYVVSARLKNGAPEKKATLKAGFSYGQGVAPVKWDVTSSEFQLYTGTFTASIDATLVCLGYDATVNRTSVTDADRGLLLLDYSGPYTYLGEEYLHDLVLTADALEVEAGTSLNLTAKAVNQVGADYVSKAPVFNYYAVTADRADSAGGFSFIPSADTKTAKVEIDINTEPGTYVLMAEELDLGVEGFKKGITIEVTKPVIRDTEPGANNIEITVTDGDTTVGVFDEVTFNAAVVDASSAPVAGTHEFSWYVLNEERTDKIDSGFVLNPSDDTASLVLSLEPEVEEGNYYIVAETDTLRKSIALKVDKTNDIITVINNISQKPDKFTADIETVIKLLELGKTYVAKADPAEVAAIIIDGAADEELTDKATLTTYVEKAAVVALYNKNANGVELSDEDGNFVYEKQLGLDKIDANGVTLYKAAMAEMSKAGKSSLQSSVTGKDFANYAEFMDELIESLMLTAIANPKDDGSAYIDALITEANLELIGIKDSKYFDIEDASDFVLNKLVKKTFTVKTLEDTLNQAYETQTPSDDDDDDDDDKKTNGKGGSVSFGGGGGGGSSSGSKDQNNTSIVQGQEFDDVAKTHWAYTDIHYLRNIGVINGTTETTYEPEATVTREQFLKILIEAFKLGTAGSANAFGDVDANAWYAPYVAGGVANGIINGKSESEFGVGEAVTRQDVCVMIDRALKLSGEIAEEISFKDAGEISEYAKAAVAALAGYGIVNGVDGGAFAPKAICTRAQAAKIISRAISISNSLGINGR